MHGCEIRIYPAFADGQTIPGIGVFKVLGTSVIIRIGQISDDSPAVAVEPVQTIEELPELFRAVAAAMHLVNAWDRQRGNEPPFDLTKLTQGLFSGRDCRADLSGIRGAARAFHTRPPAAPSKIIAMRMLVDDGDAEDKPTQAKSTENRECLRQAAGTKDHPWSAASYIPQEVLCHLAV